LLENVSEVHNIKGQNGVSGYTFEIKSGETKTQHICATNEERQDWLYTIMKAKNSPESVEEEPSPREPNNDHNSSGNSDTLGRATKQQTAKKEEKEENSQVHTWKVENQERAKIREAEFETRSKEELQKLMNGKLEKQFKKECDKLITAWKDEKSMVLDIMRRKELENIENTYQQLQLELELERQERRSKIYEKN